MKWKGGLLLILLLAATGLLQSCWTLPVKPTIEIQNNEGKNTSEFSPTETVGIQADQLKPETHYHLRIFDLNNREISHAFLTTDTNGHLAYAPLWYDIGIVYEQGMRKGCMTKLAPNSKYRVVVTDDTGDENYENDFAVVDHAAPSIFASDKSGNPLRAFIVNQQDAYLAGKNFQPGSHLRIRCSEHQYNWLDRELLAKTNPGGTLVTLEPGQTDFLQLVLPKETTQVGSYDAMVSFSEIDDAMPVKPIKPQVLHAEFYFQQAPAPTTTPLPAPLEQQMTCRKPSAPPPAAPNPDYKDAFAVGEEVWAAINPKVQGKDYSGKNARIYVVPHLTAAQWKDGLALNDVSNGYEEVVLQPSCANVNYHLIWPNPRTPGAYDVVVNFEPFGNYKQGTDIVDMLDAEGLVIGNTDIDVNQIKFNWGSGSQAITLQNHVTDSPVPVPEWDRVQQIHEPAAYVRNTTITVLALFHKISASTPNQVNLWATCGKDVFFPPQPVTFFNNLSNYVTFTASAPLPGYIKKNDLVWQWYYSSTTTPSAATPIAATNHIICTTWKSPLELPAYKEPMLWTSEWAQYLLNEKVICDSIIYNLPGTGLKYGGIDAHSIDEILDKGGGMCGGWYKMFAHMAACQGVLVYPRFCQVRNDAVPVPELKWEGIVIKSGGLNRTEPAANPLPYADVDTIYPNPAPTDIVYRNEKRYEFCFNDGHCVDFLNYQGKIYLYDPSFGAGPFANTFDAIPLGSMTGKALAGFRTNYHDKLIDYLRGNINISDGTTQRLCIRTTLIPNLRDPNDDSTYEIHYIWY